MLKESEEVFISSLKHILSEIIILKPHLKMGIISGFAGYKCSNNDVSLALDDRYFH